MSRMAPSAASGRGVWYGLCGRLATAPRGVKRDRTGRGDRPRPGRSARGTCGGSDRGRAAGGRERSSVTFTDRSSLPARTLTKYAPAATRRPASSAPSQSRRTVPAPFTPSASVRTRRPAASYTTALTPVASGSVSATEVPVRNGFGAGADIRSPAPAAATAGAAVGSVATSRSYTPLPNVAQRSSRSSFLNTRSVIIAGGMPALKSCHDAPPSVVRYTLRSVPTYACAGSTGSTATAWHGMSGRFAVRSVHVAPASVEENTCGVPYPENEIQTCRLSFGSYAMSVRYRFGSPAVTSVHVEPFTVRRSSNVAVVAEDPVAASAVSGLVKDTPIVQTGVPFQFDPDVYSQLPPPFVVFCTASVPTYSTFGLLSASTNGAMKFATDELYSCTSNQLSPPSVLLYMFA